MRQIYNAYFDALKDCWAAGLIPESVYRAGETAVYAALNESDGTALDRETAAILSDLVSSEQRRRREFHLRELFRLAYLCGRLPWWAYRLAAGDTAPGSEAAALRDGLQAVLAALPAPGEPAANHPLAQTMSRAEAVAIGRCMRRDFDALFAAVIGEDAR